MNATNKAAGGGAATTKRNKKKRNLTPELQFRLNLDQCSKTKDLSAVISLFESATTGAGAAAAANLRLTQNHYNSFLYVCSNSVVSDDPSTKDSAIEFGMKVYNHMLSNNIVPNEATATAAARLAAAKDDGDAAFELANSVGQQGKLRTFGPALFCFCRNGMADKAFRVEEQMTSLGLHLQEPELAELLRVSMEKGKGDKVYEYLHKLRETVRSISGSTADLIESWFSEDVASEVGLRSLDVDLLKEAKVRNGGGWHGLGWLGRGRWMVQKGKVASDGRCFACGEQLVCVDIDRTETDRFARSVASLAMEREVQSNFKEFQVWLEESSGFEAIVDGANVGLYEQNFEKGGFSISQLDDVVRELYNKSQRWPLIVLHKRRIAALFENASNRDLLQNWTNQGILYGTPHGSNDDWYWLYAAVKFKCLLVTNDEMRDHIFELLGSSFFPRWKERHQVKYTFVKGKLKLIMPPLYSVVIQESEKGSWHLPLAGETDDESLRTWLCIRRPGSSETFDSESRNGDEIPEPEIVSHGNNSYGSFDSANFCSESQSVTGKRKER